MMVVQYTNFFLPGGGVSFGTGSFNADTVKFAYKVSVVPEQDYKSELISIADENRFPSTRMNYNQHGIRVLVTQSGRIGAFDFQTMLVNFTVSLGLLAAAAAITDFIAFALCPARSIYQQYRNRTTVDMSDVRDTGRMKEIVNRFKMEEGLVDPLPKIFADALAENKRLRAERTKLLSGEATPSNPLASGVTPAAGGIPMDLQGMELTVQRSAAKV